MFNTEEERQILELELVRYAREIKRGIFRYI